MLGNLFREKKSPYDKREYMEYLRKQAEIQNSRRRKDKYMTEQEYKMNINQLNVTLLLIQESCDRRIF